LWERHQFRIFVVMVGIASIPLVVGGIVIMNIMLVSVTDVPRNRRPQSPRARPH